METYYGLLKRGIKRIENKEGIKWVNINVMKDGRLSVYTNHNRDRPLSFYVRAMGIHYNITSRTLYVETVTNEEEIIHLTEAEQLELMLLLA